MNKQAFPLVATILLISLMLGTLGVVSGIFYVMYKTDYVHQKIAAIEHNIYLRTLQDPDQDKDGLSDVAETKIYNTDSKKFDSKQAGIGDGEYIYNLYKTAFETNNESLLTTYRQNLDAYKKSFSISSSSPENLESLSLEDAFNARSLETYNLYVGLPDDELQILKQALDLRQSGNYEQSLSLLQDALSKNTDSSVLKYHLGLTYHDMKQYDKALQIYKGIENEPAVKSPLLYHDLATSNYALGNEDEFVRYLKLSIKTFPEDLFQYLTLATYYQEKNELDNAKEVLNEGLKIEPRYASYYNALAIIASLQGDNKTEFDLYKKAVGYDFLYAPGHENLAILYNQFFNDSKNALVEARIALEIDPAPRNLAMVILLYNKTGATAKAKELEAQLLKMPNVDSNSFNSLGLMYLDQNNYKQAEFYFRKAFAMDPNFPNAYNNLGIALSYMHRLDEAIVNYKKAIELNPNYANAYNNLGALYKDTGKYQEALTTLKKAIQLNPNMSNPYMNIGEVYRLMGDASDAVINYKKSVSLGGNDPAMLENIKILEK
ncbi:MAG: tetratricopeptide repeat protein [Minisyncoccota bacterium]